MNNDIIRCKDKYLFSEALKSRNTEIITAMGKSMSENLMLMTEQAKIISEHSKALASILKQDSELISFSQKVRNSIAHTDLNTVQFDRVSSNIQILESIKALGEAIKLDKVHNSLLCPYSLKFYSFKQHLRKYSLTELLKLYIKEKDEGKKNFLWGYIIKKKKIKEYNRLINKVNSRLKEISSYFIKSLKRNFRFYLRKINAFLFKNLDDYHDNIIINKKLFVVENQLLVLNFNNYKHERKYFKKN